MKRDVEGMKRPLSSRQSSRHRAIVCDAPLRIEDTVHDVRQFLTLRSVNILSRSYDKGSPGDLTRILSPISTTPALA